MKKLSLITAGIALLFVVACTPVEEKNNEVETLAEATMQEMVDSTETAAEENPEGHFGKVIEAEGAVTVEDFTTMMADKDSLNVKLLAVAKDVCQKKGCWMNVETADGKLMRVKFKDYGFFVPKDLTGKQVVFEGIAYKDTTSVEDLRHYAEDGGQSQEEIAAITEPEINTSFLADGVVIVQ